MMEKNFSNKISIEISKNFLRLASGDNEPNNNLTKDLIFERLVEDEVIDKKTEINWIETDELFQGLKIINKKMLVFFSQKLDINGGTKSRNTFVLQNSFPCFKIAKKNNLNLVACLNPYDKVIKKSLPNNIIRHLKILNTLDVKISKSLDVNKNISKYRNINEFEAETIESRNKNKGNQPCVFTNSDSINIYGSTEGASKSEFMYTLQILKELNFYKKNIKCIIWKGKKTSDIDFIFNGIEWKLKHEAFEQFQREFQNESDKDQTVKRNQILFNSNIIEKYKNFLNINECFACDYNISANLISAHIHRVSDIIRDFDRKEINSFDASQNIISGDNGFLLCPNHDKEYEKGMIFFNVKSLKFEQNPRFIDVNLDLEHRIIKKEFKKNILNSTLLENVFKHYKRINLDFNFVQK